MFEVGKSYQLTVGVIGGGGGMLEGVTLELALYYRDAASNQVTVATTSITNAASLFPNLTHFIDCTVGVPTVAAGDASANRPIGMRFLNGEHQPAGWLLGFGPSAIGGNWTTDAGGRGTGEWRGSVHVGKRTRFAV